MLASSGYRACDICATTSTRTAVTDLHTIEDVVARGMCVGCGACSVRTNGKIPLTLGRRRSYEADLSGLDSTELRQAGEVCPFSDESSNEDHIASRLFGTGLTHHPLIGHYSGLYAGRLLDEDKLLGSSSGGLTSWVAAKLLEKGHVDGILHLKSSESPDQGLFSYQTSYSVAEFTAQRKSMYYASTFAGAVESVRGDGRKYALIGVPCFLRAGRLLAQQDAELETQLAFFLGLVCGHLKSQAFAEALAWQTGVGPDELETVDFRVKAPGRPASHYDFGAQSRAGTVETRATAALLGGSWGHAMFQLNACNYCDDIFAETADVAFGDAWLPRFKADWRGTNVIVSRRPAIDEILRDADDIWLEELSAQEVADTQAGNFRHRRVGLSVRLHDDIEHGLSVPVKRVPASIDGIDGKRLRLVRLRRIIADRSHGAFARARAAGDLRVFLDEMQPLVAKYSGIEHGGTGRRINQAVRRRLRKLQTPKV